MIAPKFKLLGQTRTPRWHFGLVGFGVFCLVLACGAGWYQSRLNSGMEKILAERHAERQRVLTKPVAPLTPVQMQKAQALQSISGALNAPWLAVLDAVEATASPRVRLQQLDLNAGEGSVRLVVEGESVSDIQRLNATLIARGLTDLRIEGLQANRQDASLRQKQAERLDFRGLWPKGMRPIEGIVPPGASIAGAAR